MERFKSIHRFLKDAYYDLERAENKRRDRIVQQYNTSKLSRREVVIAGVAFVTAALVSSLPDDPSDNSKHTKTR